MNRRIAVFLAVSLLGAGLRAADKPVKAGKAVKQADAVAPAEADESIHIGMIPETGATQAAAQEKAPLKAYLAKALGREVRLSVPADNGAMIDALAKGTLDFAYLDGLTYIKAHKRSEVVPLVQRPEDMEFHALFIAGAGSSINSLQDLKGKKFAFGDINSTSGQLIPSLEIKQAGLDPDGDLRPSHTRNHAATAKAVASGEDDAGALDEAVYASLISEGTIDGGKVRVFHTSQPFVDHVWVARKEVDPAMQEKFVQAFLGLKEGRNDGILKILRGKSFVRANNQKYGTLRLIAQQLRMF